jgi:putative phage-type endonuclease
MTKMHKYIKHDLIQGSQEWLDFRKNKIGSSIIPAICGVSPYQSRNQLLKEFVTGEVKAVNDFTQKIFADGHAYEEIIRDKINQDAFDNFKPYFFKPAVVQAEHDPEFFASLDGLCESTRWVLEVKSTSSEKIIEEIKSGICPDHYAAQVMWQLFITEYDTALLAVIDKRDEALYTLEVKRDDDLIENILIEVASFQTEVESSKRLATIESDDLELKYIAESKKVVSEYQKLIDAEEEKIKTMSEGLLQKYAANCIIGHNVKIEFSERKGNVDYSAIPELKGVDTEPYRKAPSRFIKITVQKQTKVGNDNE